MHKILRLRVVKERTGLSKASVYKKIAAKEFPKQIPLGRKSVGWLEAEINAWIEQRINHQSR